MTSQGEQEGNIPNPFLNPIDVWQNYLTYWMEVSRNFYENAVRTNEQWLKAGTRGLKQEIHHKEKR